MLRKISIISRVCISWRFPVTWKDNKWTSGTQLKKKRILNINRYIIRLSKNRPTYILNKVGAPQQISNPYNITLNQSHGARCNNSKQSLRLDDNKMPCPVSGSHIFKIKTPLNWHGNNLKQNIRCTSGYSTIFYNNRNASYLFFFCVVIKASSLEFYFDDAHLL